MKKRFLAATVMAAVMAWGAIVNAGPGNIKNTVHNMSNIQPSGFTERHWYSDETEQICIFCHTPHNAQPAQPLWNKVNPTQAFKMYTSSTTLTTVAKGVTAPGPESLLCLSCHDGRTAINVLHNSSVGEPDGDGHMKVDIGGWRDTQDPEAPPGFVGVAMNLPEIFGQPYGANLGKVAGDRYAGNNLMDDHPISFSYTAAYDEKVGAGSTALNPIAVPRGQGFRFFGSNNRMECSTCHDPHVDYGKDYSGNPTFSGGNTALDPFLVRDNSGSAMCLACHNK